MANRTIVLTFVEEELVSLCAAYIDNAEDQLIYNFFDAIVDGAKLSVSGDDITVPVDFVIRIDGEETNVSIDDTE